MGNQKKLFTPQPVPLIPANLNDDASPLVIPPDVLQLQTDAANVVGGLVDIETFPPDYQEKIKSCYRFSATRMYSNNPYVAKRTTDTLDIV